MFNVTFTISAAKLDHICKVVKQAGLPRPAITYMDEGPAPALKIVPKRVSKHGRKPTSTPPRKYKQRGGNKDAQIVTLTGKTSTPGSIRDRLLKTLEKLEVEKGIGTVNRAMLREEAGKAGIDVQIIGQLMTEGFISTN